jgi:hypothetical protein
MDAAGPQAIVGLVSPDVLGPADEDGSDIPCLAQLGDFLADAPEGMLLAAAPLGVEQTDVAAERRLIRLLPAGSGDRLLLAGDLLTEKM